MDLLDNSMNETKNYLQCIDTSCTHSIVDDYIDVSYGEKSIKITYCEICLMDTSNIELSRSDLPISSNSVCPTSR